MTIKEKLHLDKEGLMEHGPINIVIFGDSVSLVQKVTVQCLKNSENVK